MTADRLLKFYPRAWRQRYGDELLDLTGPGDLRAMQVLDISMGAIDAWLSTDVHRSATNAAITTSHGGGAMLATLKAAACTGKKSQISTRDSLIATAAMLGGTFLMATGGTLLKRAGYVLSGEAIVTLSFTVPMTLAMHMMYLRTQPRRVQVAITGGTLAILLGITWLNTF